MENSFPFGQRFTSRLTNDEGAHVEFMILASLISLFFYLSFFLSEKDVKVFFVKRCILLL